MKLNVSSRPDFYSRYAGKKRSKDCGDSRLLLFQILCRISAFLYSTQVLVTTSPDSYKIIKINCNLTDTTMLTPSEQTLLITGVNGFVG